MPEKVEKIKQVFHEELDSWIDRIEDSDGRTETLGEILVGIRKLEFIEELVDAAHAVSEIQDLIAEEIPDEDSA